MKKIKPKKYGLGFNINEDDLLRSDLVDAMKYALAGMYNAIATRFKPGDACIYHGPQQAYMLAPGDAVEVVEDLNPGYRIKLDTPYATTIYTCADAELSLFLPTSKPPLASSQVTRYSGIDSQATERKEQGLCTTCGTKLAMSSFGLLPCSRCPQPLAKW